MECESTMPTVSSKGKPRLIFSSNDQDKLWRLKEKIVAVIESYYQDLDDLFVYSSVGIKNIVGDDTEVDVAFSSLSDPTDYFEFIQVRDRENTQGRPWIEQLLGQRQSLKLKKGIMVSTTRFSTPAKRLAKNQDIPLRLLLPESDESIYQWYAPDVLSISSPLIEIDHSCLLLGATDRIIKLDADSKKISKNNILVKTEETNKYSEFSLQRVFDLDIRQNSPKLNELIEHVPRDNIFHSASIGIEYKEPRLYVNYTDILSENAEVKSEILPIMGIVFFVKINRRFQDYPICHKFKYIDAQNNNLLAQAIVSEINSKNLKYYYCLIRHHIDKEFYGIGGGFFR